jgi:hypothetical protein
MAYTTINKSTDYFNTKLYTGNGGTQSITGVGFQPDWVWGKERTSTSSHFVFDAVRGATKNIHTNTTAAETTPSPDGGLTSFDSDGFSTSSWGAINESGQTYASWNWKAGTSFTNDASATGIGTIDSSGSANDTAGFSICSWVGTGSNGTIKHGLSTIPEMMIIKNTGHDTNWSVYTKPTGELGELRLNNTDAFTDDATLYNDTAPTSSVFSVGTNYNTNHSDGRTYIGYIFSSVKGYSKFGSYTGNDNADGTFVYTGFKPAWIIRKNIDGGVTESWFMEDNKRNTFNPANEWLAADQNSAEGANNFDTDFLSNGFKMRSNNHGTNKGSTNYIYMAFAEEPLVANVGASIPATAR